MPMLRELGFRFYLFAHWRRADLCFTAAIACPRRSPTIEPPFSLWGRTVALAVVYVAKPGAECSLGVQTGKARSEQKTSAPPPQADFCPGTACL